MEPFFAATAFQPLDYAVLAAYMASLVAVGFYYRKSAQKSLESYFLAERKMSGWLTGFSYAATCMNTDAIAAYCGMTVISGICICWWYISRFGLALMIGALLFASTHVLLDVQTRGAVGGWTEVLYALLMQTLGGCLLGLVFIKTRTLWPGVVCHYLVNWLPSIFSLVTVPT